MPPKSRHVPTTSTQHRQPLCPLEFSSSQLFQIAKKVVELQHQALLWAAPSQVRHTRCLNSCVRSKAIPAICRIAAVQRKRWTLFCFFSAGLASPSDSRLTVRTLMSKRSARLVSRCIFGAWAWRYAAFSFQPTCPGLLPSMPGPKVACRVGYKGASKPFYTKMDFHMD